MARTPPYCMTIQDFVKEALQQGCVHKVFGTSSAIVKAGKPPLILPAGQEHVWVDDAIVMNAVRLLDWSGFDISEAALRVATNWAPSESEQT
ncbi:MAG: hypothetical protein QM651_12785 [Rhodoblastus sp.]